MFKKRTKSMILGANFTLIACCLIKTKHCEPSLFPTLLPVNSPLKRKSKFQNLSKICFSYFHRQTCNKFKKTWRRLLLCSEVDRTRFTIHNTISAPSVSPHVPPPLYRLYLRRAASVSFRMSRCEHLWSGTTNSFILPPMSTLATNAANV